ncbi:MAG: NAD+ synthase [Bacteroidales bacterium]|nr:NAD+ synthase [Bacteroidales bacterium]
MNIRIVQHDIVSANPEANGRWIAEELNTRESREALLTIFPACTLCGYPLFAAASYEDLQKRAQQVLQQLIAQSEHQAFIVGLPLQLQDSGLCNALVFVHNGAIRATITKKNLSHLEHRYFARGNGVQVVRYQDQEIAIGFYEDMKELERSAELQGVDAVVCCACNIFAADKPYSVRYRMVKLVEKLNASAVYVNRTGGEGSYLFAGGSLALGAAGTVLCQMPYFEEQSRSVDLQLIEPDANDSKPEQVELIYKALTTGVRDYFAKNGLKRAVLGLSGGIDSALVAALAVAALGADNVHGLLMPSQYSTDHSVQDAVDLARNLGMKYDIVPIADMFETLRGTMKPLFGDRPEDVTEENMQARIRGIIVMSYANKFGALALNTTNKSEAAMGYGTLYGDSCGALGVIADLYKTDVYELSNWINRNGELIPQHTIDKAPSAELRPGQKDSDSLPDYEVLDSILEMHIEGGLSAEEIVAEGFDRELVETVVRKTKSNEWKRLQFPPQLRVSTAAFGLDRRVPIS